MGRKPNHGGGGSGGGGSTIPAPTGLTVTDSSDHALIQWNAVTNATAYWIYKYTTVIAIVNTTSYTDMFVSVGATYSYSVAAVVNSTLGAKSAPVTVTIQ